MGIDAVGEGEFADGSVGGGVGDDGGAAAVGGADLGGVAGAGAGDDDFGSDASGDFNGGFGDVVAGHEVGALLNNGEGDTGGFFLCFYFLGYIGHGLDGFDGVFAVGGFAAEHECVGAVVDGVGDIGYFGSSGTGIVDHGVEHLGGGDDGFYFSGGRSNHHFLNIRYFFGGDFDAEVAAGYHDAVGAVEDGF